MSEKPQRKRLEVDGEGASFLAAGEGPAVLLLHGTYWSRVWQPVIEPLAQAGLRAIAVDLKGCGRSAGELDLRSGSVPALTSWTERFIDALGLEGPINVVGHDIGGAIAQRLSMRGRHGVATLALVNSVSYDSWPVPGVARFRDPGVVESVSTEELVEMRRQALMKAIFRPTSDEETAEYLSPWTDRRVARSWMSLAGAADSKYTLELMRELRASPLPKLLVWGEEDTFQPVEYAERFVDEVPNSTLVRISRAGHIPMENDAFAVANALSAFFIDKSSQ